MIKNSIILNDVYLGDNTYIENCIVESRDTIRANTRHVGENGVKVVVEKTNDMHYNRRAGDSAEGERRSGEYADY